MVVSVHLRYQIMRSNFKVGLTLFLLCFAMMWATIAQSNSIEAHSVAQPNKVADTITVSYMVVPVLVGKKHNPIMRIKLDLQSGITHKLSVHINLGGSTDLDDVRTIRVFKTEQHQVSPSAILIDETHQITDQITFNGELKLEPGEHWLLVTCELKDSVDLDHYVQATLIKARLDDKSSYLKVQNSPKPLRLGVALRKQGDEGVKAFRIPGLVTTNKGTLVAVYDIRYNGAVDLQEDIDVGMSRSTDGGQTWEPMKVIMDLGTWGNKPHAENGVGDPSVLVDRTNNTIWVAGIWAHGHGGKRNWFASKPGLEPRETSQLVLVKSEDDGLTWSQPINITRQIKNPAWHLLLQGPGKGITLSDGTLVFPAQYKDRLQVPYSTLIYSRDHGVTWHMGSGVKSETTEAQLIQLKDGTLMINARNNHAANKQGVGRVVATSDDLGKTWTEHATSIIVLEEPTCMASLISENFAGYDDLLLFSNPNTHDGRYNMTIKASQDQGFSWPEQNWLLVDEGRGRGYSCLSKIDEQTIGILYESSQADLVFQRISVSDIMID